VAQGKTSGPKSAKDPAGKPQNVGRSGGRPSTGSRESVAAARQTTKSSNRTQLIIGIVAVSVMAIVVVTSLILNRKQTAAPVTDHPKSVSSTSTVSDGVITVTGGPAAGKAPVSIDLYEDGICPACQAFESQFGQQIMKAVDQGQLTVRYHFLNFLNDKSASKDYSTRAAAAFQCVGAVPAAEAPKGLFLNFHTTMFTSGTQPAEDGAADLSNADIAAIAIKAGAPPSAASCITSGQNIDQATKTAAAAAATLTALAPNGAYGTPSATKDGQLLALNDPHWLTNLLP
jgi:protein-disulfide isomerase